MKAAVRYSVSAQWAVVRYVKNVQMYMLQMYNAEIKLIIVCFSFFFSYMLAVQTFLQSESIQ